MFPGEPLTTPRLWLSPLGTDVIATRLSLESFTSAMATPDGTQFVAFPRTWPGELLGLFEVLVHFPTEAPTGHYVIIERARRLAVGNIGLKGAPVDGAVEIGYNVNHDQTGRGFATEAARAFSDRILAEGLTATASTAVGNLASQRVLINAGFRESGPGWTHEDGPLLWWRRDPDRPRT